MRSRRWLVVGIAILCLALPGAAIASHQFTDVPSSHIFHTSISWLADSGITVGCNPPANTRFCPDDPVNRGQMATFLKRFHDTFIVNAGAPVGLGAGVRNDGEVFLGNGFVPGMNMTLHVPTSGVVFVTATAQTENLSELDAFSCGINTGGSPVVAQGDSIRRIDLTTAAYGVCATQTGFVVTPGTYVARLTIAGALNTTETRGGHINAVLYSEDGFYSLLGTADDQVEFTPLSDEPTK